jgi:hypothetical protein
VLPVLIGAALLAAASVLAVSSVVRAGIPPPTCSVLVSSTSSPVPAETLVAYVGETGTVTGSGFTPDTEVTVDITVNGTPFQTFPFMTDGSGGFTFGGPIPPEQIGTLVLTVTEGQVCSDSITATILAAPTPTPEGLPNAAMAPPSGEGDLPAALGVLLIGLLCLAAASFGRETEAS